MTRISAARSAASIRRVAARVAITAMLALVVASGAAAPGGAVAPSLSVEKLGFPATVTHGYKVLYTIKLTNGATAANDVTITDPAPSTPFPAGTTITSATTTVGACPLPEGATSVTCSIGHLDAGQPVTVKVVVKTTTNTAVESFTNVAQASLNEGGNDRETPAKHIDTWSPQVTTSLLAVSSTTDASGYFDTGCDTANPVFFGTNTNVGPGNLQATEVCVPDVAGGTTITVGEAARGSNSPGSSETSKICVPQTLDPVNPCTTPLQFGQAATFRFTLDPSQFLKNWSYKNIVVYDDGVPVTAFCNSNGSLPTGATVCKFPATRDSKTKIVTQVVRSLSNGSWNFG